MKKQILEQFKAFFIASGQSEADITTNLADLSKMNLERLLKLKNNFNL